MKTLAYIALHAAVGVGVFLFVYHSVLWALMEVVPS